MALARNAGFTSAIATDPADTAAGLLTPDRYNLAHVVSGATVGSIPYFSAADAEECSDMTWKANGTAGEGLLIPAGTATTDVNATRWTQTWNNAAVTFTALEVDVTDTASNAASMLADFKVGGSSKVQIRKNGVLSLGGTATLDFGVNTSSVFTFSTNGGSYDFAVKSGSPSATNYAFASFAGGTTDAVIQRIGANHVRFGGALATTTSRTEINKAVASIADNTATATFTVTVPNAAHGDA